MIAPAECCGARFRPNWLPIEAAPLMCAGVTTFNALRNSGARAGRTGGRAGPRRTRPSRRAVRGEDGISHGRHRARKGQGAAGADNWARRITSTARRKIPPPNWRNWAARKSILATVTDGDAMAASMGGLAHQRNVDGHRRSRPNANSSARLIQGPASVKGWYSGTSIDSQDTLAFSVLDRRAVDERSLPAGTRQRSLRTDDERQSALPRRDRDGELVRFSVERFGR